MMPPVTIGRRVVCVLAPWRFPVVDVVPALGRAYTVRDIVVRRHDDYARAGFPNGIECFVFYELANAPRQWLDGFYESCFPTFCFALADMRPTSIEAIRAYAGAAQTSARVGPPAHMNERTPTPGIVTALRRLMNRSRSA